MTVLVKFVDVVNVVGTQIFDNGLVTNHQYRMMSNRESFLLVCFANRFCWSASRGRIVTVDRHDGNEYPKAPSRARKGSSEKLPRELPGALGRHPAPSPPALLKALLLEVLCHGDAQVTPIFLGTQARARTCLWPYENHGFRMVF